MTNSENSITSKKLAECIREEFSRYGIKIQDILLFGCQATQTYRPDSDWDFLIITDQKVERTSKRKILAQIRKRFVFENDIDSYLLVLPTDDVPSARKDLGRMSYYAIRDGISV